MCQCHQADEGDELPDVRKMLESGHPPDNWNQLLDEARAEAQRRQRFTAGVAP